MRRLGRRDGQGGAVAVEFALVLPLFLLLVLGGIDWGYYFFVGQVASNAAREAARAAATRPLSSGDPCADSTTTPVLVGAVNVAKNYLVAANLILPGGDARLKPFDCTAGNGCCDATGTLPGYSDLVVQVKIRYEVRPGSMSLTGFLPPQLLPPAVVATATMRLEP